ncbi:MAG TPA: toxin-antitoxin system HicB family antitoxin [Candidatus Limnocylindria bacterium]|nr:toxin-antitoxin system HicB family antitoxin [Candidatus Limnocylindria bacterium]
MTRKGELDAILAKPYATEFIYGETPDEGVVARVAEWPGCMTAGATREEAIAQLEDAMHDWADARLRAKLDIAEPIAAYSGKVLLRMPRDVHRAAEHRARREGTSLNTWLVAAIARELGPARDRKTRAPTPRRTRRKAARRVQT